MALPAEVGAAVAIPKPGERETGIPTVPDWLIPQTQSQVLHVPG